jgi:8-amino-7-oxononanoate synthase
LNFKLLTFNLQEKLDQRKQQDLYRTLVRPNNLIDFCSNDYLGFAQSPVLAEKIKKLESQNPVLNGSTGSRLLNGNSEFVEELEKWIANFHKAQSGLIFNSGYDANLGFFSAIPQAGDTIIYDELIHASIHDGKKLSKADSFSFVHNDLSHLEQRLQSAKGNIFVAVESIYSMDGDQSPLREIAYLCEKYNANLIVDEAHATGVIGEKGRGLVNELQLESNVFARIHTFGKALGCHGAIILGGEVLSNYLINYCRPFIYSTALPPHSLYAIKSAYELLSETDEIRKLKELINYFRYKIQELEIVGFIDSLSPIQCIVIPGNSDVRKASELLKVNGFDVRPILNPTVPKGKERLRICIHSYNNEVQINELLELIKERLLHG